MSGIVSDMKHKSIIVNGVSNHVHIFLGLHPTVSVSDTVYEVKRGSSLFINNQKLCLGKFAWQEGYGSFTYSKSQINDVYNYILSQEQHHKNVTFKDEYITFLRKFMVEFEDRFLFDFLDDIE